MRRVIMLEPKNNIFHKFCRGCSDKYSMKTNKLAAMATSEILTSTGTITKQGKCRGVISTVF